MDEVCWELCKSNYIKRDNPVLPDDCVYMLFRIFCMLGEMVENDKVLPEVVMAAVEVESATFRFMSSLGQGTEFSLFFCHFYLPGSSMCVVYSFGIGLIWYHNCFLRVL